MYANSHPWAFLEQLALAAVGMSQTIVPVSSGLEWSFTHTVEH